MKEQKTVRQWFEELPERYRERALKNMINDDRQVLSMADALDDGFNWHYTPEGRRFWRIVYNFYKRELPPLPK